MEGKVEIVFSGGVGKKGKGGVDKSGKVKSPKEKEEERNAKLRQRWAARNVKKVASATQSMLLDIVEYEVDKNFMLSDNVQAQRDKAIIMGIMRRSFNFGKSVATGFSVGGIWGAVIGGGISMIKYGVDIYQGYDKQNIKIAQLEEQLAYTRLRSGYALTSGDKGENR